MVRVMEEVGMIKRINQILNTLIACCVGVFIGHGCYVYFDYKKYSEIYAMQSAPWYTSILVYGLFTIAALFLILILKYIIKKKIK